MVKSQTPKQVRVNHNIVTICRLEDIMYQSKAFLTWNQIPIIGRALGGMSFCNLGVPDYSGICFGLFFQVKK
jgi:hypothetical protein